LAGAEDAGMQRWFGAIQDILLLAANSCSNCILSSEMSHMS